MAPEFAEPSQVPAYAHITSTVCLRRCTGELSGVTSRVERKRRGAERLRLSPRRQHMKTCVGARVVVLAALASIGWLLVSLLRTELSKWREARRSSR